MCGIFGWSVRGDVDPDLAARLGIVGGILAEAMDDRGGHAWGSYRAGAGVDRGLGELAPSGFVPRLATSSAMFAHTRYATIGDRDDVANAHPFVVGRITGAHNGAVWNHAEINARYGRRFAVDSMHVFAHLDERRPLAELTGYGAVEFVDARRPASIFLGTFANGQLAVVRVPDADAVVWASTIAPIKRALAIAGLGRGARELRVTEGRLYVAVDGRFRDTGKTLGVRSRTGGWGRGYDRAIPDAAGYACNLTSSARDDAATTGTLVDVDDDDDDRDDAADDDALAGALAALESARLVKPKKKPKAKRDRKARRPAVVPPRVGPDARLVWDDAEGRLVLASKATTTTAVVTLGDVARADSHLIPDWDAIQRAATLPRGGK